MVAKLSNAEVFAIRKYFDLVGGGLFFALMCYIDYRALSFAGLVAINHPNVAHEIRVLVVCALVSCVASLVLYSLVQKLTMRTSFLEFIFKAMVGALTFASFVAITTAMAALGVRFF